MLNQALLTNKKGSISSWYLEQYLSLPFVFNDLDNNYSIVTNTASVKPTISL